MISIIRMFMSMVIWMNLFMQRTLTRLWNKFSSAMTDLWSLPLMPVLEEWTMWFYNRGEGSIKPGSGVNKDLAPVGDIYITGIVNFGGFMDYLILQNTRLSIVMKMADIISMGIRYVLWKLNRNPKLPSVL